MRAITRKAALVGSALVLSLSGIALGTTSASAAGSCYSSGCNGLDPASTTCANDAVTALTSSTGVELRYSPSCRTAWARMRGTVSGHTYEVCNSNNYYCQYVGAGAAGSNVWTKMVDDKDIYAYAADRRADWTMASSTLWY